MEYRKSINILIVLFLVLGIFTSSTFAETCFCKKTCLYGLKSETKASFLFHLACPGNLCKSCNLEKGQMFKAANSAAKAFNLKILDAVFILCSTLNYLPTNQIIKNFDSFFTCGIIPSSSVYLQNLSILC